MRNEIHFLQANKMIEPKKKLKGAFHILFVDAKTKYCSSIHCFFVLLCFRKCQNKKNTNNKETNFPLFLCFVTL